MKNAQKALKEPKEHRLSVTFSDEQYEELSRIADKNRVSLAWVVRDAVDKLLTAEAPLFRADAHE